MTASTDTYRRDLLTALERRDVDPERICQVLAEVESHVARWFSPVLLATYPRPRHHRRPRLPHRLRTARAG